MNDITFRVLSLKDALHRPSSLRSGRGDGASPSAPPAQILKFSSVNKNGSALIEILFLLPLFILCISLLETISEGMGARIQNRLLSRYVSTCAFRNTLLPTSRELQEKFFIKHPLSIQGTETTQIQFQTLWQKNTLTLTQHFFLWRKNHDSLFESARSSDEEEEF